MTKQDLDLDQLKRWIGRTETSVDRIDAAHAAALAATFDQGATLAEGDPLPALWHWNYFRPAARQSEIGKDGHPRLGGFMPPIPLPRRMWVGGRLSFHEPLRIGDSASRLTEIADLQHKVGRSGPLILMTLRREISTSRGIAVTEEQDLVYREAAVLGGPLLAAPAQTDDAGRPQADWRVHMKPDPVLLFRYSAMTFNGHRIHYDLPYARDKEGYRALVVHGPLTASLLVGQLMTGRTGKIAQYSFRAEQPLFCGEDMAVCGRKTGEGDYELWAETPHGQVAMSASAIMEHTG